MALVTVPCGLGPCGDRSLDPCGDQDLDPCCGWGLGPCGGWGLGPCDLGNWSVWLVRVATGAWIRVVAGAWVRVVAWAWARVLTGAWVRVVTGAWVRVTLVTVPCGLGPCGGRGLNARPACRKRRRQRCLWASLAKLITLKFVNDGL